MKWINVLVKRYLRRRSAKIEYFRQHPKEVQSELLMSLLYKARHTEYGQKYDFRSILSLSDFSKKVPISDYEELHPWIDQMMHGIPDVLWPGQVRWFAKSSGTTNDKSKFIPVSPENLSGCHVKSSWDAVALLYERRPDMGVFSEKNLVMGGSLQRFEPFPDTHFGDVSAIMVHHMPVIGRPFYTPDFETALLPNWDEKIEKIAQICSRENVTLFGGVPTWTIVLFNRILELTGKENMLEVWPEVKAYMHGGVGFGPYEAQFRDFIPTDDFIYHEVYNASEGFFAVQDQSTDKDMLLLLDNGMYFEFLPEEEWESENPEAIPLWETEIGKQYALVVSTNSGLWRYTPGDTVRFTSVAPYRIQITGRTRQCINVFGEEVMIANTDRAIAETSQVFGVEINDYTVAPIFLEGTKQGGHQWLVEFNGRVPDVLEFSQALDQKLQALNGDYEAKRYQDMALQNLELIDLPQGTFQYWMASKGKLGGQHKVPRLSNNRKHVEEILALLEKA